MILLISFPLLGWKASGTQPFGGNTGRSYRFQTDPNAASVIELRLLPGIGEKLADAIILERNQSPFKIPADLQRVKGIGPKKLEAMRPFLPNTAEEHRKP